MSEEEDRQKQIETIYAAATQVDSDERAAFLEKTCGGDEALLSEVASLLATNDPNWLLDQSVDHYKILSPIGRGGMGQVFLAEDLRLRRKVAIKFLPAPFMRNEDRVRRFVQEARAASALNHPNIVTIHEFGESPAGSFIVMEFVQGRILRAVMEKPVPAQEVIRLGVQIARALSVAHAVGIVHRDIKPDNIVLRDDGYVKVLDFGLARLTAGSLSALPTITKTTIRESGNSTAIGSIIGTINYMSPEQVRARELTSATDVFSLGIILYEMATGKHPFKTATKAGTMTEIVSTLPPHPSELNPAIPASLDTVIMRSLEKDARYRVSASELAAALSRINEFVAGVDASALHAAANRRSVGRDREHARLRAAFETAAGGHGVVMCIAGEPGSGKTTLIEDFLSDFQAAGQACTVARGRCSERLSASAYMPVLESLESLSHEWTGSIVRSMKELAPSWYAQVATLSAGSALEIEQLASLKSTSPERLKQELADFFQEAARFRPLILFFDDLHWADESTTDLLLYLSGKLNLWRMLIIGAYRPADLAIRKHPFLNAVQTMEARGVQQKLDLGFLSRDDIENYLALEFPGHRFPPHLASLIHTRTEGNPLFMADLVRYLRARGVIVEEKGQWTLSPVIPADLPESVRSMVQKKIDQLSPEDRQLLAAASVQGSQFDSAVVSKAAGLDPALVEDRLDDLDRMYAFVRLMDEQELPDGTPTLRYRFVHALYQDAFYGLLKPTRRSMLSNAVAEALLNYHGDQTSSIALNLALLFETARAHARAADFFLMAAQRAAELFAYQEAVGLARRGLDALKRLPESTERAYRELQLQTALGGPLTAIKGFTTPEVGQTYARARDLFQRAGEPAEFFPMLFGQWAFYYSTAQIVTARAIAEQSLRLAQREHEPVKLLLANHLYGATLMHCGEFDAARSALDLAIDVYAPEYDRQILRITQQSSAMIVWTWSAFTLDCLGYRDQALQKSAEALRIARDLSHPPSLAAALFYAGIVHQLRREPRLALERANASIALAEEHGFPLFLHNARQLRGWALAAEGDVENGKMEMKNSLITLRAIGTEMARGFFLAMLADVLLRNNELDEASKTIEDGLECVARTGDKFHEPELHRLKGELLSRRNAVEEAEACLRRAIDIARGQNAKVFELRAVAALAQLVPDRNEPRAMLQSLRSWFTEGFDTVDLQEANRLLVR